MDNEHRAEGVRIWLIQRIKDAGEILIENAESMATVDAENLVGCKLEIDLYENPEHSPTIFVNEIRKPRLLKPRTPKKE